ncbi:NAD(P)H-hydrate epimerase [Nocardioides dilutus]
MTTGIGVSEACSWLPADRVPAIGVAQMRRVDELMIGRFGVGLAQMMENAGRSLAELAQSRFAPGSVTVLVGAGNNGGGGLVAARHLANHGLRVEVVVTGTVAPGSLLEAQLLAALACGVTRTEDPGPRDLVVDALVGYGLTGPLRGRVAELAAWANSLAVPVLALDGSSGLDLDTGLAHPGAVHATATMTLALPKHGLLTAPETGELYLADISVPSRLYSELGLAVPVLFTHGPVVRLRRADEPAATIAPEASDLAWRTWWQAGRLIATGATFATAARIALVVGTLLTAVNLGGRILGGQLDATTGARVAANYLIPYVVSSLGLLAGTRVRQRFREGHHEQPHRDRTDMTATTLRRTQP